MFFWTYIDFHWITFWTRLNTIYLNKLLSWFFRCLRVKTNNKKIITLWFHNSCMKRLEENLNSTTLLITKPLCAAVSAVWLQCHMMLSSLTILVLWHSRLKELWAAWRYAGGGGGRGWRVHPFVLRAISCLFSSFPWTVKLFFVLLSGPEIWTNTAACLCLSTSHLLFHCYSSWRNTQTLKHIN